MKKETQKKSDNSNGIFCMIIALVAFVILCIKAKG